MEVKWRWKRTEDVVGCPCCDGFALECIPYHRMGFKKIYRCPLGHTFYCYLPARTPGPEGMFLQNMVTLRYETRIALMVPPKAMDSALSSMTAEEKQKLVAELREPCFTPAKKQFVKVETPRQEIPDWSITGRNYACPQCKQRCHEVYCFVKACFPGIYRFRCPDGHEWESRERWEEANWKSEQLYQEPPDDWKYIWGMDPCRSDVE